MSSVVTAAAAAEQQQSASAVAAAAAVPPPTVAAPSTPKGKGSESVESHSREDRRVPTGTRQSSVSIEDRSATAAITNWQFDSGAAYSVLPTPAASLPVPPPVKIVAAPNHMNEIIGVLRKAKRSIAIGAYSIDHTDVLTNLENALKRGVNIRLLIDQTYLFKSPSKNIFDFLETLLATYTRSKVTGVCGTLEIRAFKPQSRRLTCTREAYGAQLHAKFGIVDDAVGWLGSCNLTTNSASWFEIITIVADSSAVATMKEVFEDWWSLDDHAEIFSGCSVLARETEIAQHYRQHFS